MASPEDRWVGGRGAVRGQIKVRGRQPEAGSAYRGALLGAGIPLIVLEGVSTAVYPNCAESRAGRWAAAESGVPSKPQQTVNIITNIGKRSRFFTKYLLYGYICLPLSISSDGIHSEHHHSTVHQLREVELPERAMVGYHWFAGAQSTSTCIRPLSSATNGAALRVEGGLLHSIA
jgi:hypothetical protein